MQIFTPEGMAPDAGAVKQMETCLAAGSAVAGSLSADHHLGYSMPIGGSIFYTDHISPSGVGYDIGCGNKAVRTDLRYEDIRDDMSSIMDEVFRRISFGVGRPNDEPVDHPVLDAIGESSLNVVRELKDLAAKQLGTVGSGNHYVDLFVEESTGLVWIGVHFGSRGFGHNIATGFLSLAQGNGSFYDKTREEGMHAPPSLLEVASQTGQSYLHAMELAGDYAYAGRDTVVNKVLEILGNPGVTKEVHNHHNFAWEEQHLALNGYVVRKGATPLWPWQEGFIGSSMGEASVIVEGSIDYTHNAYEVGESALWSAPHGAGRVMSRTEAKGKSRKRWHNPATGWVQSKGEQAPKNTDGLKKIWVQETAGKIDWQENLEKMAAANIELRGAAADEAPGAYKRLPAVLEAHSAYVNITHTLQPIGVAMAGENTVDPYKD